MTMGAISLAVLLNVGSMKPVIRFGKIWRIGIRAKIAAVKRNARPPLPTMDPLCVD